MSAVDIKQMVSVMAAIEARFAPGKCVAVAPIGRDEFEVLSAYFQQYEREQRPWWRFW